MAVGACTAWGEDPRVLHSTLEAEWSGGEVPGTISDQAWEWSDEEAEGDSSLSPLPDGVLVRLPDGVVALDGVSGEERWSLRVEETRVWSDVSASGQRVHVLFPDEPRSEADGDETVEDSEEETGFPGRRLVLDGTTGEVIGEHEEDLPGDVEELGVFDVESATDAGLFGLGTEPQLSASMRSDADGSELWGTGDLFACGDSKVARADRPVVFPEAVVVRAECGSGQAQMTALDPDDGSTLWSMTGDENEALVADGGVRRAGTLLAVHDGTSESEPQGGSRYAETLVVDPVSGEVVGEGTEVGDGRFLAATSDDGYLVSTRSETERVFGYELRDLDGGVVAATGEEAVRTPAVLRFLLPLEEALVKLEPAGRGAEGGDSVLTVAPWGAEEAHTVALPRPVADAGAWSDSAVREGFLAVPGAVVLIERPREDRDGVTILGFR
ncbi:hypothetical protein DSY14_17815 [Nocardiopsis sp. MG754419]|nr:hypothetical protein [Nocardiopsis sp. MG754419]